MLISRTPFRVSLFGGGTDYPQWFEEHGGIVVGMAIDKYCYVAVNRRLFHEHQYRLVYSAEELCNRWWDIKHPLLRGVIAYTNTDYGVEIIHSADIPARSGIGSSSAFAVGLINALYTLQGHSKTKYALACHAINLERHWMGEVGGYQDQIWAAYGGFNEIRFNHSGDFDVKPIDSFHNIADYLALVYTGVNRVGSEVARSYANKDNGQYGDLMDIAEDGLAAIKRHDIEAVGRLLHKSWKLKQELSPQVSNAQLDELYHRGLELGAFGGKLIGSGGGGFFLFAVPKENRAHFNEGMRDYIQVPFKIDYEGSKVVCKSPPT